LDSSLVDLTFHTDQSNGAMTVTGAGQLSLSEIITHPTTAFTGMQANFMANYQTMAVQAIGIGVGFKVARKLLRRPISVM
jgi:hypothetical protein